MRLFISLNLDQDTRSRLKAAAYALRRQCVSVSLPPEENYHLTLAFLGEREKSDLVSIRKCIDEISSPPVDLKMDRLGYFGRGGERLYFVSAAADDNLFSLQRDLIHALDSRGFKTEDRAFKPHITIARRAVVKDGFESGPIEKRFFPICYRCGRVSLMQSQRIGKNMVYTELYGKEL